MAGGEREKKKAVVQVEDALPADVVSLILVKTTPCTLWSSRLVCKLWYSVITSPEFVARRRSATGGAWLVTMHHMNRSPRAGTRWLVVRSAWILLYNPLLNIQEKVSVPIYEIWPKAKSLLLRRLSVYNSEHENLLVLQADFARSRFCCIWNPFYGPIERDASALCKRYVTVLGPPVAPSDVVGPGWTQKYDRNYGGLMAYSVICLKIFQPSTNGWELLGEMPDDMWQLMKESDCSFVVTPNYTLIWTQHAREPETVALFQPSKGSWTWVDNIWHSRSPMCRWTNKTPLVFSCF